MSLKHKKQFQMDLDLSDKYKTEMFRFVERYLVDLREGNVF